MSIPEAKALLLIALLAATSYCYAGPGVEFEGDGLSYLMTEEPLTPEQVLRQPAQNFVQTDNFHTNLGFILKTLWFKTSIVNQNSSPAPIVFEVAYPRLSYIDFYAINAQGVVVYTYHSGTEIPAKLRPISHLSVAFPLQLNPGEKLQILMKTSTDSPLRFPVKIWEPEEFRSYQHLQQLLQGLYYGGIFIMVIYNLFVFIGTGNRSYLYYCLFVTSTGCYLATDGGMLLQYVFTDSSFWNNKASLYSILAANTFGVYFASNFMNLQLNDPRVHRLIRIVMVPLFATIFVIPVVPYYIGGIFLTLVSTLSSALLISITIRGLMRRQREAYFYSAAWTCLLVGTFAYGLLALGFIESTFFTERGLQLGSFFEVTILSFALADRLNQLRLGLKDANDQLAYHIATVEEQVLTKTRDIRSIMEHIPLGVFSIDSKFLVHKDYSRSLESMLHTKVIAGQNALELLFQKVEISADRRAQMKMALHHTLGEEDLAFEMNRHCFVDRIHYHGSEESRIYDLLWNPVCTDQGLIDKILVTVHDSTRLLALEEEAQSQKKEMAIIQRILEIPLQRFQSFLRFVSLLKAECALLIHRPDGSMADRQLFLMKIHTLKGLSRSFYLGDIADLCHLIEELSVGRKLYDLIESWTELVMLLDDYKSLAETKLGRKLERTNTVEVNADVLQYVIKSVLQLNSQALDQQVTRYIRELERTLYLNLSDVLSESLRSSFRLAAELGKAPPKIEVEAQGFGITPAAYDCLLGVLTHLIRNSLDHGIEAPDIRQRKGKQSEGTLAIKVQPREELLELTFSDDGQGLALAELRTLGLSKGMLKSECTPQDIAELIFAPDLSTKDSVSLTSGRGLGLSAVRDMLRKEGGDIRLTLLDADTDAKPFQLKLILPVHFWNRMQTSEPFRSVG